jgi:hypothetical protein
MGLDFSRYNFSVLALTKSFSFHFKEFEPEEKSSASSSIQSSFQEAKLTTIDPKSNMKS